MSLSQLSAARSVSGTSWLPDSSHFRGVQATRGAWSLSLHGAATGQFIDQPTVRGDRTFGITDWEMVMVGRAVDAGYIDFRAMTSLEAAVLGTRGYPLLLQSGERLSDRQAPRDALMELSARYYLPLTSRIAAAIYAAPVGEPALGPVNSHIDRLPQRIRSRRWVTTGRTRRTRP